MLRVNKGNMVIVKLRTQRTYVKKIICYYRNLNNLICKWDKEEGLKCKG